MTETRCAKITDCELLDDGKIKYSAKACRSNLEFQFSNYEDIFPAEQGKSWTCPKNHYVKVEVGNCWGGMCYTPSMDPVTDSNYWEANC